MDEDMRCTPTDSSYTLDTVSRHIKWVLLKSYHSDSILGEIADGVADTRYVCSTTAEKFIS